MAPRSAIGLNGGVEEMTRARPGAPQMDSAVVVPDRVTEIPAGVQIIGSTIEPSQPGKGRLGQKTAANQSDAERASELLQTVHWEICESTGCWSCDSLHLWSAGRM